MKESSTVIPASSASCITSVMRSRKHGIEKLLNRVSIRAALIYLFISLFISALPAFSQQQETAASSVSPDSSPAMLVSTADSSKGGEEPEWTPEIWKAFCKYGPVKDNLPDFSHAGYKMGLMPLPDTAGVITGGNISNLFVFNVTDKRFGAVPDDGNDDTAAIQSAIESAGEKGGIVFIPSGRYEIHSTQDQGFLQIHHDNVVIRGESEKDTILHFGSPGRPDRIFRLGSVPAEREGRHWTTIAVMGSEESRELTRYTDTVLRGEREIRVMDTSLLRPGMTVSIEFDDPLIDPEKPSPDRVDIAAQLTHPLKLVKEQTDTFGLLGKKISWIVRIEKIIDSHRILLVEPARFDQFLRYSPRILSFTGVTGVGIENLTLESSWKGGYRHHKPFLGSDGKVVRTAKEQDYLWGGIWESQSRDGWIRNVTFNNLTQGIIFSRCGYMTAQDLTYTGLSGHAGVTVAQSHGVIVDRAHFYARLVHPVSLKNFSSGNVVTNCETYYDGRDSNDSTDAVIDFHGLFPYENLFENMRGFYICPGGDTSVMPHSGVRNVFWNIEAPEQMSCYSCEIKDEFMRTYDYGNTSSGTPATMYEYQPQGFFVGITRRGDLPVTMGSDSSDKRNKWMTVEGLNRRNISIPSLYKAQFEISGKTGKRK